MINKWSICKLFNQLWNIIIIIDDTHIDHM